MEESFMRVSCSLGGGENESLDKTEETRREITIKEKFEEMS